MNSEASPRGNLDTFRTREGSIATIIESPRPTSLSIVVEPYTIDLRFRDFWDTFGDMISLVGGGFAAGLSALLIDRFKNRSKYRSRKIDDWS